MNSPKIKLKNGHTVPEAMAKPWETGTISGYVTGGDGRPYCVVITEHGELEMVFLGSVQVVPENEEADDE